MKNKMKFYGMMFLFCILATMSVSAYPTIVSSGINHTDFKETVYSFPEELFDGVEVIEYSTENKSYSGVTRVLWYEYDHYCYNGKITLYNSYSENLIWHELGHVYEYCNLKRDSSSELFARLFQDYYARIN